jgi:Spy/CpxP family protein refolding chaperone
MRKIAFVVPFVLLGACSHDASGPQAPQETSVVADAGMIVELSSMVSDGSKGLFDILWLSRLPDNLKLSAEQQAKIAAAVQAAEQANKADLQALDDINRKAQEAIKARKTRAEVSAILAQAAPILQRLSAAAVAFHSQILAILTQAQRDWLAANDGKRCDPAKVVPLTDAQKAQIKTLTDAFVQATKADVDAIAAAMRKAEEAKRAGKSEAEVKAILDAVKPAVERVAAAEQRLRAAIDALLTPEQRASNCPPELGTPAPPPKDPGNPSREPGKPAPTPPPKDPGSPSREPGKPAPTPPTPAPPPGSPRK